MGTSGATEAISGAVAVVAEAIRRGIRRQELLPGEPIRQVDMAQKLGVSRVPVREALGILLTEGILHHDRHRGYFVAKLEAADLEQISLMRRTLETALLQDIEWPDAARLTALQELNDEIEIAAQQGDIAGLVELNRRFHDSIFELSRLRLVHREVQRLWTMAAAYHAMYLYGPARLRISTDHREVLDALQHQDRQALIAATDAHRAAAQNEVSTILSARASQPA